MEEVKVKGKVFYGWWIVLAGSVMTLFGSGTYFYGFSVFFKPMADEFGWSRGATAGAFSLSRLEGGLEGPLAGWLIDRVGPRIMVLAGVGMFGAGFVLLSLIDSIVTFYVVYGVLLSLGYNTGFTHALFAAVSNWFIRFRARAMSGIALGAGLGGTLMLPVVAWLVGSYGWRATALIIGIGIWVVGIPLSLVFRRCPEDHGLWPDGDEKPASLVNVSLEKEQTLAGEEGDFTVREALRTRTFWVFALASTLRVFVSGSVVVHGIPFLTDIGVDPLIAASAMSAMTLFSLPSRILFGWLGDFRDKRKLMALACVVQGFGLIFLASATMSGGWMLGVPVEIALFVVVYGFFYGAAAPLNPALRADFFGRKSFATIGGLMSPLFTIGTVGGPVFAGLVFDATKSYVLAFSVFAVVFVLSGVVYYSLKPPRKRAVVGAAQPAAR